MHYKDGTVAQIGDLAKGTTYNRQGERVGTIVSITPGSDLCNCKLANIIEVKPEEACEHEHLFMIVQPDGSRRLFKVDVDYTEVKALEKVA